MVQDTEKQASDPSSPRHSLDKVDEIEDEEPPVVLDKAAERRLVWKFDLRILPTLAVMYLFNTLDKTNLGNAKTAGLEKSLGMQGTNQYSLALSIFFIPYVLTAPFLAILGKKYGPNRVLPAMMLVFGSCTMCVAAAENFAGLMTIRWFLGMAESAFFPLVIYYQTTFYRRMELARRLAIFYAGQSIASAFGGLLAFGVFRIKSDVLESWRFLPLIEGAGTILFSIFAYFYLPRNAATAHFLNDDEKILAEARMLLDSSASEDDDGVFNLRDAAVIFLHPTTWAILVIEICLGVPLQAVQLFLPQIIGRLGYDAVKTNLYTVAPNVSGAVMLLILGFASDMTKNRWVFIALGFMFTFVGMVIYAGIDVEEKLHIAYFASFMMTCKFSLLFSPSTKNPPTNKLQGEPRLHRSSSMSGITTTRRIPRAVCSLPRSPSRLQTSWASSPPTSSARRTHPNTSRRSPRRRPSVAWDLSAQCYWACGWHGIIRGEILRRGFAGQLVGSARWRRRGYERGRGLRSLDGSCREFVLGWTRVVL
jgi:MFS family permease